MEIKEIRIKTATELQQLLSDSRKKLDELLFRVRQKQVKNIREVRVIKKDIAKIITVLKEKTTK